ncbi:pyocin activator PrtN family protein [Litorilituus sediminis]|uniref:Pyocin activator protein PrtN n=1 Tax=Litorilituus sediminis TaxID=718192 RepID=A0A4P6P8Y7_9GAMM|nr:pyocin activator PrtN family protein [Litorilituus sediminis]QBG35967.1 hypothetical protein EMK97_09710 [Litorilituus sediminis]
MSNRIKNQVSTTLQSLKEEFNETLFVRLDRISERYLGMKTATAKRRAGECALPFPVSRLNDSQKSPYVVQLTVLADYIDNRFRADYDEWKKAQYAN